jgi:hypothetical protein
VEYRTRTGSTCTPHPAPRTRFLIDLASSVPLDTIISLALWGAKQGTTASPPPPYIYDVEDVLYREDARCAAAPPPLTTPP